MAIVPSAANDQVRCRLGSDEHDALIVKYNIGGPRYTSYPTAASFITDYTSGHYRKQLQEKNAHSIAPLSLYVHIPFCQNICYYCACNKVVSADHRVARQYLDYLSKEIVMQSAIVGKRRPVMQLHFGGGTPTYLDGAELTELMHTLASHFLLTDSEQREYSIEIDPRTVTCDSLALLKGLGFNRISMGVQDFDEAVQRAINRQQGIELVRSLTEAARLYQFNSVSYDLIYGLPHQTLASMAKTLEQVIALSPDRIAFYNYAHLPERFRSQRAIDRQGLPSTQQKVAMLTLISESLVGAGYRHIGMDHFVKPDDELAVAQHHGKLQRNFQGYSTCMAAELIGLGVSAISNLENSYAQNDRTLSGYYQRLDQGELAIERGYLLTRDDCLRRAVIMQILCKLQIGVSALEQAFYIDFSQYFSSELSALHTMQEEGLLFWRDGNMHITERGRVVLRNICMVFDKYLHQPPPNGVPVQYSRAL